MKINNNAWNKIRYTFYSPVYDFFAGFFGNSRRKSINALNIKVNDRVLIIGAGTGLDLKYIPDNCEIIATDITPSMIKRIEKSNNAIEKKVQAIVMDGHSLQFPDTFFDKIIMHLILAVIPDPVKCIREAERVLKPGGEIAVFDKFRHKNTKTSLIRKVINIPANFLFSDITRSIEEIAGKTNLSIISDEPALFKGNFRIIKLKKI